MNARAAVSEMICRHPFGISRGSSQRISTFFLELEGGGIGQGTPVRYKNQDPHEGARLAMEIARATDADDLHDIDGCMKRAREIAPDHSAALAAFDMAMHDRVGRDLGIPLYELFGYARPVDRFTSFTIGLDTDEKMSEKTAEAAEFPVLKIKLGRPDPAIDIETLGLIRREAPGKTIYVDANAAWDIDQARVFLRAAADMGLEFLEQPLAIGAIDGLPQLRREFPVPLIADEDVQGLASLPPLVGKVDGINIKLMKCGGLWEARQMIGFARAMGWKIMLGCMIECSIGMAAATHLASAADYLDLDGEALIVNNPAGPVVMREPGKLTASDAPGLGIEWFDGMPGEEIAD